MSAFADWLLSDLRVPTAAHSGEAEGSKTRPWWQVMCLTGVDYFSSLGYAPGISFLAAGALSPIATVVLVLVTLFAALPAYSRVAEASPNGQGSIAMLERLFPRWAGKIFVLVLLGFATTDFIITITLSAADGAAHLIANPYFPHHLRSHLWVTVLILAILGAIFLRGFSEAITIAVVLVGLYLILNAVVVFVAMGAVLRHPEVIDMWRTRIFQEHGSVLGMIGVALLLFPRLALGMSGFETGVAVMPLIRAKDEKERIRSTRFLLTTAALIMSVFLIGTSITTTFLIPAHEFHEGGHANGRAVAWLAHRYLGNGFGTLYDFSTILILGFAGASAMAGLLNLIPRYLPRFGMAPDWARASRPLVVVFFSISLVVTWVFHADVDAQGGAYATGVLVLMMSAAIAVAISVRRTPWIWPFGAIAVVFVYTTAVNMYERPEGLKISSIFIGCILFTSFLSRAFRSTELRITKVTFDEQALKIINDHGARPVRLVAVPATAEPMVDYKEMDRCIREDHHIADDEKLVFLESEKGDSSDFDFEVCAEGKYLGIYPVLRVCAPAVPNAYAAIALELTRRTGHRAHIYFTWPEGNPFLLVLQFIFFGDGYTALITHEILRKAVRDPRERPLVHVV
jgi:hypothetical protein